MTWQLVYTKQAQKDARKLISLGLKDKTKELLRVVELNPYQNPPIYKKLVGDLAGAYSRRINIQDRLAYQVLDDQHIVKVLRVAAMVFDCIFNRQQAHQSILLHR